MKISRRAGFQRDWEIFLLRKNFGGGFTKTLHTLYLFKTVGEYTLVTIKTKEGKMKMSMKKGIFALAAAALVFGAFGMEGAASAKMKGEINVISREDGSGTRGAFIELFGVEQKNAQGKKVDCTTDNADITNSTSVMMTSVAGNPNAIGYISLGSLNTSVKALKIDGSAASVANIKAGSYKIARPFNIAVKAPVTKSAQAFIDFIMSAEGQSVVEKNGYIAVSEKARPFSGKKIEGKVTVAGSSSVTPVMEKLKEAYLAVNPAAEIEIQQSDSSTGMKSAISGICNIGMASRELKDSEKKAGLTPMVIAMDGIAVIVNTESSVDGLTSAQVRDIFTGKVENWEDLK